MITACGEDYSAKLMESANIELVDEYDSTSLILVILLGVAPCNRYLLRKLPTGITFENKSIPAFPIP